ncbi:hypothetical protein [Streptomyces acidicola]
MAGTLVVAALAALAPAYGLHEYVEYAAAADRRAVGLPELWG